MKTRRLTPRTLLQITMLILAMIAIIAFTGLLLAMLPRI